LRVPVVDTDEWSGLRRDVWKGNMAATEAGFEPMWTRMLIRPAQVIVAILLGACVVSIVGLGLLAFKGRDRLEGMRARVAHTDHMLRLGLRAQQSLLEHPGEHDEVVADDLVRELRHELEDLRATGRPLDPDNDGRLDRVASILEAPEGVSRERLIHVVNVMREVLKSESAAQAELWNAALEDTRRELVLVATVCAMVPILLVAAWWIRRRWIDTPLDDLRRLLAQLGGGARDEVGVDRVHPSLVPLFENYNRLVRRLDELETAHRTRASGLEAEVRAATEALLEQQATLARAERLAAVGETTASLAHELRNPLSGILMSLGNLRREAEDADTVERLDLVIAEIERLTRMLNDALAAARHRPEPSRRVDLRELVTNLLALLAYQVPPHVTLVSAIGEDLVCSLPEDRIRQALLNLILNSVQAAGGRPTTVTVGASRDDGHIQVTVCDDGPGFPDELVQNGIRAFATGGGAGTGLGLAIVRRVAADLGGEVQVSNIDPHGACVRLTIGCSDG